MSTFVERDAVEVVVAAQWFRILGSTPESLDTNFFDSGGNSLAAARLTTALCKAFHTDFPVQVVFDAQTFRGISDWIRRGIPASGKRLVTLNDKGDGIPLLLLPSGGGGVIGLQRLGGAPLNRQVFGLQALGLDPRDGLPFTNLDEMIADFVRVVEESAVPRTLHLAGYCAGGVFAYELARALRTRGWDVVSVSLFNTSLYRRPLILDEMIEERLTGIASSMGLELAADEVDAEHVFHALKTRGTDILEADLASFEARLRVYGSLWIAVTGYQPQLQDVPVRLFNAADRYDPADLALMTGEDRDWSDLGFADFRSFEVEVSHRDMLRHEPTLHSIERSLAELDGAANWQIPSRPAPTRTRTRREVSPSGEPGLDSDALLALGRGTDLPEADRTPVHELVAEHMRTHPERSAVSCGVSTITYGQLNAWATQIASELTMAGVTQGCRVGVLAEPSIAMVATVIGILRCGAAYVPVDVAHPDRRIETVLSDAGVAALVVTTSTQRRPVAPSLPRVCAEYAYHSEEAATDTATGLGPVDPATGRTHLARGPVRVAADDIAYLIYTSGSTGEPKGVLVGHGELAASTHARRAVYPGVPVFLLVSPLAFDSSVAGIWGTLTAGGQLIVATAEEVRDPHLLARLIARHGVTHLLCVPSLYSVVLDAAEHTGTDGMSTLDTVIVAGEPLPEELVERHFALHTGLVALVNEYGPTEATVWASYARFEAPGPVSIGRPVPGARLYVLDEELRPLPLGAKGELYIGGAGVSRGYHGRPEATASVFLNDPFTGQDGARMYRTGDLVRWNSDGTLDFVGRSDHQVKVRGHRVELGAVETHLASLPGVREAVVILNAAGTGLLAFARASRSPAPDATELRGQMAERLPAPMVPEQIVVLESFPRTVNGKVDRAALQEHLTSA
ncbi:amino acid adenylation domain-containing protein (plasmid) [Streptomyces sp. BHT-5-2]|uniref:amino acid adenylation domain-containing protein n=1 Tax=unclassified Streptomyces TaxID=2593676 RepID=UPI001C8E9FD0|nr:amino acid adenylation domain-containing protein [Streptomyces sp. BHT-5-2]QZL08778.1 amino acid adenylation domain-containing protein [Streptomyces sp. BHT-5-2]